MISNLGNFLDDHFVNQSLAIVYLNCIILAQKRSEFSRMQCKEKTSYRNFKYLRRTVKVTSYK